MLGRGALIPSSARIPLRRPAVSLLNLPDAVIRGTTSTWNRWGSGDHPAEVPISTFDPSARRSLRIVRRAAAVAAAAFLAIGVASAPVWAAAPANDELAGATHVALGDHITQDTTEATTSDAEAAFNQNCWLPVTKAMVWYTFTPTADTAFAVDTGASSYSAGYMLFEGTPSANSMITCGAGSSGAEAAHAGKTYTIAVVDWDGDGDQANGGNLVLDLVDRGPLPTLKVTLDPRANVDKSGAVWLTGTYSCSLASRIGFDIQLSENVGRFTVNGYGSLNDENSCDGSAIPFKLPISGYDGKFAGGKATALVATDACGDAACDNTYFQQTIQLAKGR